jgi:hypothetical protein
VDQDDMDMVLQKIYNDTVERLDTETLVPGERMELLEGFPGGIIGEIVGNSVFRITPKMVAALRARMQVFLNKEAKNQGAKISWSSNNERTTHDETDD